MWTRKEFSKREVTCLCCKYLNAAEYKKCVSLRFQWLIAELDLSSWDRYHCDTPIIQCRLLYVLYSVRGKPYFTQYAVTALLWLYGALNEGSIKWFFYRNSNCWHFYSHQSRAVYSTCHIIHPFFPFQAFQQKQHDCDNIDDTPIIKQRFQKGLLWGLKGSFIMKCSVCDRSELMKKQARYESKKQY